MRHYATWEIVCVSVSIAIVVGYTVAVRGTSRICALHAYVRPLWAAIHQQRKSTSSITAIQNLRNVISISTAFAAVTLAFAVLCARLGSASSLATEMLVVSVIWAAAFVNFGIASNVGHYLIFNVSLYPEDKTDVNSVPRAVVLHSWERSNRQLMVVSRHIMLGERLLLIAIPALFIAVHPLGLLLATCASCWLWLYLDRRFAVQLGSVKVQDLHLPS